MSRQEVLVDADWVAEHAAMRTSFLSRSMKTPPRTTAVISRRDQAGLEEGSAGSVRRDFINKEQFEKLLSERGISNDDTVVLYGGNNNWFAAYAYWYLLGARQVLLLDGGRKKWELDARELSSETVTRPATSYTATEPNLDIRAFRDEVVAAIGTKSLVDVRSPDEYAGRLLAPAHLPQEQAQRGGTFPPRSTCRGARQPMMMAPSGPMTNSR